MCRGFNEAVNGFADDGWSLLGNDGLEDITVSINYSPSKLIGSQGNPLAIRGGILCAKMSMLLQSEHGDIIECVDIYKQPAFDHPALKNHTIQMQASHIPTIKESSTNTNGSATITISQLWHKSGSCPKGIVPIRRIQKRDLLRIASLESFGRKNSYAGVTIANTTDGCTNYFPQANRSITHLLTEGYSYIGAMGDINVWNPYVESDDYSSAQIFLRNGPPGHYESVESGWVVNPGLYGDTKTRLFAYWTIHQKQQVVLISHAQDLFKRVTR